MDLKDYKAGAYRQQYRYKSFLPTEINTSWTWSDPKINTLLADANRRLGELNAYSLRTPDADQVKSMHGKKQ